MWFLSQTIFTEVETKHPVSLRKTFSGQRPGQVSRFCGCISDSFGFILKEKTLIDPFGEREKNPRL